MAAALADGLSSAAAGREAAESCVLGFLNDYYATPSLWSVPRSAQRVLRGGRAHLFQVGDSRIWRLREGRLECLTRDHQRPLGGTRVLTGPWARTRAWRWTT